MWQRRKKKQDPIQVYWVHEPHSVWKGIDPIGLEILMENIKNGLKRFKIRPTQTIIQIAGNDRFGE